MAKSPAKKLKKTGPEPTMNDRATKVFTRNKSSKSSVKDRNDEIFTWSDDYTEFKERGKTGGNTVGRSALRSAKHILTGDVSGYLKDKRVEAAGYGRADSDSYKKAYKASKDYKEKKRGKK